MLGKGHTAIRKNKKGKNKNKNASLNNLVEVRNSEGSAAKAPCLSVLSSDEPAKHGRLSDGSFIQNASNDNLFGDVTFALNMRLSSSANLSSEEGIDAQSVEDYVVGCNGGICHTGSEHQQSSNSLIEDETIPSRVEIVNVNMENNLTSHLVPVQEPHKYN